MKNKLFILMLSLTVLASQAYAGPNTTEAEKAKKLAEIKEKAQKESAALNQLINQKKAQTTQYFGTIKKEIDTNKKELQNREKELELLQEGEQIQELIDLF